MKKFSDIIKEVNKTRQKIKEVEKKSKEIRNTYSDIIDIKKRHEKMKAAENDIVRLEEKRKIYKLQLKYWIVTQK